MSTNNENTDVDSFFSTYREATGTTGNVGQEQEQNPTTTDLELYNQRFRKALDEFSRSGAQLDPSYFFLWYTLPFFILEEEKKGRGANPNEIRTLNCILDFMIIINVMLKTGLDVDGIDKQSITQYVNNIIDQSNREDRVCKDREPFLDIPLDSHPMAAANVSGTDEDRLRHIFQRYGVNNAFSSPGEGRLLLRTLMIQDGREKDLFNMYRIPHVTPSREDLANMTLFMVNSIYNYLNRTALPIEAESPEEIDRKRKRESNGSSEEIDVKRAPPPSRSITLPPTTCDNLQEKIDSVYNRVEELIEEHSDILRPFLSKIYKGDLTNPERRITMASAMSMLKPRLSTRQGDKIIPRSNLKSILRQYPDVNYEENATAIDVLINQFYSFIDISLESIEKECNLLENGREMYANIPRCIICDLLPFTYKVYQSLVSIFYDEATGKFNVGMDGDSYINALSVFKSEIGSNITMRRCFQSLFLSKFRANIYAYILDRILGGQGDIGFYNNIDVFYQSLLFENMNTINDLIDSIEERNINQGQQQRIDNVPNAKTFPLLFITQLDLETHGEIATRAPYCVFDIIKAGRNDIIITDSEMIIGGVVKRPWPLFKPTDTPLTQNELFSYISDFNPSRFPLTTINNALNNGVRSVHTYDNNMTNVVSFFSEYNQQYGTHSSNIPFTRFYFKNVPPSRTALYGLLDRRRYDKKTLTLSLTSNETDSRGRHLSDYMQTDIDTLIDPQKYCNVSVDLFDYVWFKGITGCDGEINMENEEEDAPDYQQLDFFNESTQGMGPFNIYPNDLVLYRLQGLLFTDYVFVGRALHYDYNNTVTSSLYTYPTHIVIQQLFPIISPYEKYNEVPCISVPINNVYPYQYGVPISSNAPSPLTALYTTFYDTGNVPIFSVLPSFIRDRDENVSKQYDLFAFDIEQVDQILNNMRYTLITTITDVILSGEENVSTFMRCNPTIDQWNNAFSSLYSSVSGRGGEKTLRDVFLRFFVEYRDVNRDPSISTSDREILRDFLLPSPDSSSQSRSIISDRAAIMLSKWGAWESAVSAEIMIINMIKKSLFTDAFFYPMDGNGSVNNITYWFQKLQHLYPNMTSSDIANQIRAFVSPYLPQETSIDTIISWDDDSSAFSFTYQMVQDDNEDKPLLQLYSQPDMSTGSINEKNPQKQAYLGTVFPMCFNLLYMGGHVPIQSTQRQYLPFTDPDTTYLVPVSDQEIQIIDSSLTSRGGNDIYSMLTVGSSLIYQLSRYFYQQASFRFDRISSVPGIITDRILNVLMDRSQDVTSLKLTLYAFSKEQNRFFDVSSIKQLHSRLPGFIEQANEPISPSWIRLMLIGLMNNILFIYNVNYPHFTSDSQIKSTIRTRAGQVYDIYLAKVIWSVLTLSHFMFRDSNFFLRQFKGHTMTQQFLGNRLSYKFFNILTTLKYYISTYRYDIQTVDIKKDTSSIVYINNLPLERSDFALQPVLLPDVITPADLENILPDNLYNANPAEGDIKRRIINMFSNSETLINNEHSTYFSPSTSVEKGYLTNIHSKPDILLAQTLST